MNTTSSLGTSLMYLDAHARTELGLKLFNAI